jgi:hypothetical protein
MEKLFKPSSELKKYIEIRRKETNLPEKQKCAIGQLNWLKKCAAMGNGGKTSMQWKTMMVANAI